LTSTDTPHVLLAGGGEGVTRLDWDEAFGNCLVFRMAASRRWSRLKPGRYYPQLIRNCNKIVFGVSFVLTL
jgi:hypothetical protein